MSRSVHLEPHQPRRGQRAREHAVGDVIPPTRSETCGVAEPALDFVGQRAGDHELASIGLFGLGHRERRGNVVAGVGRLFGKVGVIIVQVADQTAVGERCPVWRHSSSSAQQSRAGPGCPIPGGHVARDDSRPGRPRAERAAERINHAAFDLVHDGRGQVFEAQPDGEFSHFFGEITHIDGWLKSRADNAPPIRASVP